LRAVNTDCKDYLPDNAQNDIMTYIRKGPGENPEKLSEICDNGAHLTLKGQFRALDF